MGQTLSEPVIQKISDDGCDDQIAFGVSAMQGWRISMEDAHAAIMDLHALADEQDEDDDDDDGDGDGDEDEDKSSVKNRNVVKPEDHTKTPTPSQDRISFFGVYDGHGGERVAQFTGKRMHKIVAHQDAFRRKDYERALKDGFLATDLAILRNPSYKDEMSGCTASVGLITHSKIYVANAGDSRSVLGVKGRAKPLSYDHKPQNEGEKARISAAGGYVDFGRVNGNLALSRAIGDFEFKKGATLSPEQQIVTAFPDVITHTISDDDEFLVIACDGIWDCQSSQAVVEFVRRGIAAKQELSKISENMMDNCLASNSETGGIGCDNMTMVVIALLRGKPKEQWYQDIADRVAQGDGPCAPPEYAEFRGPGVHHQRSTSEDDSQMDGAEDGGRIIYLGDGTEILTDGIEDDDSDNQHESGIENPSGRESLFRFHIGHPGSSTDDGGSIEEEDEHTQATPKEISGTMGDSSTSKHDTAASSSAEVDGKLSEHGSRDGAATSPNLKAIPENAIPDKLTEHDVKTSSSGAPAK